MLSEFATRRGQMIEVRAEWDEQEHLFVSLTEALDEAALGNHWELRILTQRSLPVRRTSACGLISRSRFPERFLI